MNKKISRQNGITLIALVITIIVMLILVGVTITIALNGGLIGHAQDAKAKWESNQLTEEGLDFDMNDVLSGSSGGQQQGGGQTATGWVQDGTTVTKGSTTLNVGQKLII